jgi:hypothetical protein
VPEGRKILNSLSADGSTILDMRILLTFLWVTFLALAQSPQPVPPDCTLGISLSTSGSTGIFDNRQTGCQTWTLQYQATNVSAVTVTLQNANGAVSAGTFGTYGGTTVTGANPMTNTTGETSTFSNGTTIISWVRVTVSLTASGGAATVNGILYGWKTGSGGGGGGGGSGCPGTISSPCQIGLDNGGSTLPALGDANGRLQLGTPPSYQDITFTGSGLTQIVPGSSGNTVTIFHLSILLSSGTTFSLAYGTGTNCGTGTTVIAGPYPSNFTGATWDPGDLPLIPSGNAVCANPGSSVTVGGIVTYANP